MDKIEQYRNLIKRYLRDYKAMWSNAMPAGVEMIHLFDDETQNYLLLELGWTKKQYVRHIPLHVMLRNHKIWIEEDMTEEGIATYFLQQGVPREDIVLGFQPPEMRPYTEFAVA